MAQLLQGLGLSVTLGSVVAYWLYTLKGIETLKPLLGRLRRVSLGFGVACVMAGAALIPNPVAIAMLAMSLSLTAYAIRNQWAIPKEATALEPAQLKLGDSELVAVVNQQQGIPLALLAKKRTVRLGNTVVVHCGLAKSLAAFECPPSQQMAAVLPHASGFYVGDDHHQWDGVNGESIRGAQALVKVPVELLTMSVLTARDGTVYLPRNLTEIPAARERRNMLPGAQGIDNPMQWGVVHEGSWYAYDPVNSAAGMAKDGAPSYYLSRWAALTRKLCTEAEAESTTTEHNES